METLQLFHGGYTPVNIPDLDHSRSDIEFGKGFYLTADNDMASKWACKYRRNTNGSFVSTYSLDANDLNIYSFSLNQEAMLNRPMYQCTNPQWNGLDI